MPKILIMDDEPALRNVVFSMIKPLGHPIVQAEDGKQAIELAKKEMPDLAMLDMRVPDMDGLEVLVELKKINPNIKCIMLSGFGDVETAVNAIKQGAFDYISKPFKIDEVVAVVNKALGTLPAAQAQVKPQAPVQAQPKTAEAAQPKPIIQKESANKMPVFIGAGAAAALLIAGFLLKGVLFASKVAEFAIPYSDPTSISFVRPNSLFVADWVAGSIYEHKTDGKLSIASVNKTLNTQPSGIAYDGEYIWSCNTQEQRVYKHIKDEKLTVEKIFALSGESPSALFCDTANLWIVDSSAGKIYKHKLDDTLGLVSQYDSPALNPCGMFKVGEFIYVGDYKSGRVYKVNAADLGISNTYEVKFIKERSMKLAGIACDGENIWFSAEGNPKIYKMPLNALTEVKL